MSAIIPECRDKADSLLPRHFHGRVYLDADILPSAHLRAVSIVVIVSAFLLTLLAFYPLLPDSWLVLLSVSFTEAACGVWCLRATPMRRLRLDHTGWSLAEAAGPLLPVAIESEVKLWGGCAIVGFRYRSGRWVRLVILPDSMAPTEYQRLRVWLVTQAGP